MQRTVRFPRVLTPSLIVAALLAASPVAAQLILPDPSHDAYWELAVIADEEVELEADVVVAGDVHSNGEALLASGSVIDGDLAAVGSVSGPGTVTGTVTSPAPERALPPDFSEAEAIAVADTLIEGDATFDEDVVFDEVLVVLGDARFQASINGVGTVIATGSISFDNVSEGSPAFLDPGTRMAFLAAEDVVVGKSRALRGVLQAGRDVTADKELLFEGVVVAGRGLRLKKDSQVTFLEVVDQEAPTVTIEAPAEGSFVNVAPVEVFGTVADDGDVESVFVNGVEATMDEGTFSATVDLETGFNLIFVEATDWVGRVGSTVGSVTLDPSPPELFVDHPAPGQVVNTSSVSVRGQAQDEYEIAFVEVQDETVALAEGTFDEVIEIPEGPSIIEIRAVDLAGNEDMVTVEVLRLTLPEVAITSPPDLSFIAATSVDVGGTVTDGATVAVNGVAASVSGTTFTAAGVPLIEGGNVLTATATNENGYTGTDSIHVVRDVTPPRISIDDPADGSMVFEPHVAVRGLVNDIVAGTVNVSEATVTVDGTPAEVANRSFSAAGIALAPGANQITVEAIDLSGNRAEETVTVTYETAPTARVAEVSGGSQSGVIGTPLPEPLVVEVRDASGQPVSGVPVVFRAWRNNGHFGDGERLIAVDSDAAGRAATTFTLGTRSGVGNQTVRASAIGFAPAIFAATALPAEPTRIVLDAGGLQVGIAGRELPRPLVATVTDFGHNRLAEVPVLFRVVKGGGVFANGLQELVVTTDSDGRAITTLTLDPEEGIANNVVEAVIDGFAESALAGFVASGKAAGAPEATSVSGVVLDNTNRPIAGVTMRIKHTTLTAVTDAEGQFQIDGAPVGSIKLIADGSTADRPGSWPDLEFDLVTIPGRDNTVNMPILLLPLDLDNGVFVDETTGGTVTLPDLPGFRLDVAPGSVIFPGGGRSGVVSVTAVHSDKVPMVPNFGQQPRLIVTIQPAGARFEPPARLTLPNVEGLAPGEVTEMYSFDHDLGHFVSIGPATVGDDGITVASNPGVGIIKAGWHCGGNPAQSGTPNRCKDCWECTGSACEIDFSADGEPCDEGEVPASTLAVRSVGPDGKVCKRGKCVCAVPVDFRQRKAEVQGDKLYFEYEWDSNTGRLKDLAKCEVWQEVRYLPFSPGEFTWPPPFMQVKSKNPTETNVPGDNGEGKDTHGHPPILPPYVPANVAATQEYYYVCPCQPRTNLLGPFLIWRRIEEQPDGSWAYTISKQGLTAGPITLP